MKRLILALLLATPLVAHADVKLNPLFSDNMVLQRESEAPVWGTAEPGEEVSVTLDVVWKAVRPQSGSLKATMMRTKADAQGNWKTAVAVPRLESLSSASATLTVKGKNEIALKNVLVGDVWICSGQSNMEWKVTDLKRDGQGEKVAAAAANPNLRFFTVTKVANPNLQTTVPVSKTDGHWVECTPETCAYFSAVAYFFGRDLQKAEAVPIGLIHTSWGGTPAEAWTSKAGLEAEPGLKHYVDAINTIDEKKAMATYEKALEKYKADAAKAKAENKPAPRAPSKPMAGGITAHTPTVLYNAMIAPLVPFSIKGAIWYQGESNAGKAKEYRTLFPAMIADWRKVWGKDFPFFAVQLAPFWDNDSGKVNYAELRDAQYFATKKLPKVGLAVITDSGEEKDIHPQKKEPAGARLALAARAIAYGEKIEYSGPEFKSAKFEGNQAIVSFDHMGGGFRVVGETLNGFTLCGEDKVFHPATAMIKGDTVVVSSEMVAKPTAVRFGWVNFAKPELNLFNAAGLPAIPFRSDDFPLTTK